MTNGRVYTYGVPTGRDCPDDVKYKMCGKIDPRTIVPDRDTVMFVTDFVWDGDALEQGGGTGRT